MAEILLAEEWAEPSPLAIQLNYDLSEDYLIVSDPTIHGRKLDAVVVGPQGLFVLYRGPAGADAQTPAGEGDGRGPEAPLLDEERAAQATGALRAFLRDEFPDLDPPIYHLLVLDGSDEGVDKLLGARRPSTAVASIGSAAEQISSVEPPPSGALREVEERRALAVALQERRLTLSQRASEPFVFRSGDVFGSGAEVWTIRDAVRHMAAHPESGIYHLRNGTLAAWLQSEGAEHLARLARHLVRTHTDRRAALETFLIATGLVERPDLRVRPHRVDLGYLTAGDSVARYVHVGKQPGRGYLFGTLEPSVPWLSVYPRRFSGESPDVDVSVRADTESLPIGQRPSRASVFVHSNASEEPVEIPVRLRVMGMPSEVNRRFFRPTVGFVAAGVVGAALGGILSVGGAPGAALLARLTWWPLPSAAVWVLGLALIWGVLGALRGARQPEAWPTKYAMERWIFRTLLWALALFLFGAALLWGWSQLRPPDGPLPGPVLRSLLVIPMALAIVPGTIGEIISTSEMRDTSVRAIRWTYLRPFLLPLAAILLAFVAALGAPRLRPALDRVDAPAVAVRVEEWTEARAEQIGQRLDDLIDRLYLSYYDSGGGQ